VRFQEALVQELLLDLFDLHGLHFATVGGEFANGLFAEGYEFRLGSGSQEGGEELLFEDGEGAVKIFKRLW
jgi:hypothetical protein